jgi:hypothetical protein
MEFGDNIDPKREEKKKARCKTGLSVPNSVRVLLTGG